MPGLLITRHLPPGHPWRLAFETAGYQVRGIPFAEVKALEFESPTTRFDAYIFNSPNAVRFFASKDRIPDHAIVVAPGPGTAEALAKLGVQAIITAQDSDLKGFASELADRLRGLRVLVPCSEQTRGTLISDLDPALVVQLPVYRTIAICPAETPDPLETLVFTSPLNVEGYMLAGWPVPGVAIAIGRTTASALTKVGIVPRVCATADAAGILAQLR
jgi:uroporphyrinogen-III synthase